MTRDVAANEDNRMTQLNTASSAGEVSSPYRMTVSLNVLNHLGIGLYSNIPAVISEMVANAWDADAKTVKIHLHEDLIEVLDDGHGMTVAEVNDRFLRVGYRRREKHAKSPGGREVMGRKGIGKLSSFSIANVVEVHTARDGKAHALRMSRVEIEGEMEGDDAGEYHPHAVSPRGVDGLDSGTRLVLRELDRSGSRTAPHLRRRIARRFGIIGPRYDFAVSVDDEPITAADRDFYNKLEYLWFFADKDRLDDAVAAVPAMPLDTPLGDPLLSQLRGWIGTVDRPDSLDEVNNSIVLLARGKLVHENMLPEFKEAGMYAQYVVGEVHADFLDDDRKEDIVTSNRQNVKEDDPRYEAVSAGVHQALKTIKNQWTALRTEKGLARALNYPTVNRWYERLGPDTKKIAERLFGRIESLMLPDLETKKELYRSTILAFEKLALKDTLSDLEHIETQRDFETLARLIGDVSEIEAVHYHEVAKGRLKVIEQLKGLAPTALERVLQKLVFEHLWLLHPSWERAATNGWIEETVGKEFDAVSAGLTDEERRGRIDIRYRTAAGKHIIVELKKYDRSVSIGSLVDQLRKYRRALRKCLRDRFPNEHQTIECVVILGSSPQIEADEDQRVLAAMDARYITYDQLIQEAEQSYAKYLERDEKVSELIAIVDGLDDDFRVSPR